MFEVYDNGRPASSAGQKCLIAGNGWDNHSFPTFEEALKYTEIYLGVWANLPENWDGSPHNYSGYGDMIEIRRV